MGKVDPVEFEALRVLKEMGVEFEVEEETLCPCCSSDRISHNPLETKWLCRECGWHFD